MCCPSALSAWIRRGSRRSRTHFGVTCVRAGGTRSRDRGASQRGTEPLAMTMTMTECNAVRTAQLHAITLSCNDSARTSLPSGSAVSFPQRARHMRVLAGRFFAMHSRVSCDAPPPQRRCRRHPAHPWAASTHANQRTGASSVRSAQEAEEFEGAEAAGQAARRETRPRLADPRHGKSFGAMPSHHQNCDSDPSFVLKAMRSSRRGQV